MSHAVIGTVIKECKCGRRFDASSWGQLQFVGELPDGTVNIEMRNCPCGSTLGVERPLPKRRLVHDRDALAKRVALLEGALREIVREGEPALSGSPSALAALGKVSRIAARALELSGGQSAIRGRRKRRARRVAD